MSGQLADSSSSWGNLDLGLDDDDDLKMAPSPAAALSSKSEHGQKMKKLEDKLSLSKSEHVPRKSKPRGKKPMAPVVKKQPPASQQEAPPPASQQEAPSRRGLKKQISERIGSSRMITALVSPCRAMKKSTSSRHFDPSKPEASTMESPARRSKALTKQLSNRKQAPATTEASEMDDRKPAARTGMPKRASSRRLNGNNIQEETQVETAGRGRGLLKRLSSKNLKEGLERACSPIRTMAKSLSLRSLCCSSDNYAAVDDDEMQAAASARRGLNKKYCSERNLKGDDTTSISTEFDISISELKCFDTKNLKGFDSGSNKQLSKSLHSPRHTHAAAKKPAKKKPPPKAADTSSLNGLHSALMFNPPSSPKPRRSSIGKTQEAPSSPRRGSGSHAMKERRGSADGSHRRTMQHRQASDRRLTNSPATRRNKLSLQKQLSEKFGTSGGGKLSAFEPTKTAPASPIRKGTARKLVLGQSNDMKAPVSPRRPSDASSKGEDSGFAQIAFGEKDKDCTVIISPTSGRRKLMTDNIAANAPLGMLRIAL